MRHISATSSISSTCRSRRICSSTRVEVYTSADVTVEELKGEGDEPELTADELAKRLSDRLHEDDDL